MKIAEVKVNGTTCEVTRLVPISKGLVGATVSVEYTDSAWDGLTKTIVFRSSVTKDVVATGSEVVIPAEVVSRAGVNLYMGVYGVDAANNVVIPTIWAELGLVHGAAAPSGDTSIDPTLPVWAQIQGMIGNLDDLDTDAKSSLVAAVNEALTKGGGEIDPAEVQKIVEDYLKENPPSSNADISLGLTSATVGQTIKVKAVDADGKPTAWLPTPLPSGARIAWHKVAETVTESEISQYVVTEDAEGTPITKYAPLAICLFFYVPADSTQPSNTGNPWIFASGTSTDAAIRVIGNIAAWKTVSRANVEFFIGSAYGIAAFGNSPSQLDVRNVQNGVMNGVRIMFASGAGHFPAGSHFIVSVLGVKP